MLNQETPQSVFQNKSLSQKLACYLQKQCLSRCVQSPAGMAGWWSLVRLLRPRWWHWCPILYGRPPVLPSATKRQYQDSVTSAWHKQQMITTANLTHVASSKTVLTPTPDVYPLPSRRCYRSLPTQTSRFRGSFCPVPVTLLNSTSWCQPIDPQTALNLVELCLSLMCSVLKA